MEPRRSAEIRYIQPDVPQVERPAYRGRRYPAQVPDTLDLQEMAALAVNGLTGPTDADADYEIYWRAAFNTNPPVMWHAESDIVQGKFMEALPLMRLASGSSRNEHVEQRWMEVMRQMQGPDGLLYLPRIGRLWCRFGNYGAAPPGEHYTSPWFNGRLLGAMSIYHQLTGDPEWLRAANRVVEGMSRLVEEQADRVRLLNHEFGTEGRYNPPRKPSDAVHNPATYASWAIQGLANHGRRAGHERAIELAGKLARFAMEDCRHFGPDGAFLEEYPGVGHVHFHGHTMVLLSVLDYGLAAADREAVDFAHRGFRYGLSQGECRLGYFPEWLNLPRPQTLELCELADMLALALKLSAAGLGDYWDLADRWARNLFCEGQLRREHVHWLEWLSSRTAGTEIAPMTLPPHHTAERAIERNLGAFGGWLAPNDWMPDYPHLCQWRAPGIMHCCTGNATRAIYYLWQHALSHADGCLRVNLLLNRASPWADVESQIPYAGRVEVRVRQALDLAIRIPEWVGPEPEAVACRVDDSPRPVRFEGRYARVGPVAEGALVALQFPIDLSTEWIDVEKRTYRVLLRGNTCVAIDPPGRNVPLFRRDHYLGETRWRRIERFVPEVEVVW